MDVTPYNEPLPVPQALAMLVPVEVLIPEGFEEEFVRYVALYQIH
jgi:hypothetical protein